MNLSETKPAIASDALVHRTELLLSKLLAVGVVVSIVLIVVGVVWHLIVIGPNGDPRTTTIGRQICLSGLIVLVGTPIFRVLVSGVAFAVARDWVYVIFSAIVLAVLLGSILLGQAHG